MLTIELVKLHLRIDNDYEDALITQMMGAAQEYAELVMRRKLADFATVPSSIVQGMLEHIAVMYAHRGDYSDAGNAWSERYGRIYYQQHRIMTIGTL